MWYSEVDKMTKKAASNMGVLDDHQKTNFLPFCLQLGISCGGSLSHLNYPWEASES